MSSGLDWHYRPNYTEERAVYGKGRLVKVRFPDQPGANVSWYWIPLGNCQACVHRQMLRTDDKATIPCNVQSRNAYLHYSEGADCPTFKAGVSRARAAASDGDRDRLDVMRAAGLADGVPTQKVVVLQNLPWTQPNADAAHDQQAQFMGHAALYDSGNYDSDHYEHPEDIGTDLGDVADQPDPVAVS